ncbi:MAG TPA: formylglycine-generating enzyme family protein, partial [Pyrinomonadaceae bacterium]|nr:formylglycine-generating enzyme family protein [Pyrinomonadaceae bacterium]
EVTQNQYRAVMGTNPSAFKGDDLPVDSVTWDEATEFCRKLSTLTGHQYRLPTEAEWEYAARGGTTGAATESANLTAWYDGNSGARTHPVGQKEANHFGLYDIYGNVWEWCQSKYKPYPYSATDGREDLQPVEVRVLRGGSWESAAKACRASYRRRVTPDPRSAGFRVVLVGE